MVNVKKVPYKGKDSTGNERWFVVLENGVTTTRARWVMMNFLHTDNIPKIFHVHHINGIPSDDRIENLQLLSSSSHMKMHHPKDYKYGVAWTDDPIAYARIKRNSTPEYKKIYYTYGREYIARHPEETREYKKAYREKNLDKLKSQEKAWYLRNRERILSERKKRYDEQRKEVVNK
jgi:hypothetical protein